MERGTGSNGQGERKRQNPAPDSPVITHKAPRVDAEDAAASDASDDPFREPTRASFYRDSDDEGPSTLATNGVGASNRLRFDNDASSDDDIEIIGTVVPRQKPQPAKVKTPPPPSRASAYGGQQSRVVSTPAPEEKRNIEVSITVKFDNDEGLIDGMISVLQGTTIAGLFDKTLFEYNDAFTQNWPHVIISKWADRFQRSFPIAASEYAQKRCEDGAHYEAFFFENSLLQHKRFWYPAKLKVEHTERRYERRRRSHAANPSTTPRNQDINQAMPEREDISQSAATAPMTARIPDVQAASIEDAVEPVKVILEQCDITTLQVDAIVNAANTGLKRGGGVCGSIFEAAGTGLDAECDALSGRSTGDAVLTAAHGLRHLKTIVHAVGPRVVGPLTDVHRHQLASCYRRSLEVAVQHGLTSIVRKAESL